MKREQGHWNGYMSDTERSSGMSRDPGEIDGAAIFMSVKQYKKFRRKNLIATLKLILKAGFFFAGVLSVVYIFSTLYAFVKGL